MAEQAGFHPHPPSLFHRGLAKALGAGMWFFIFYRASLSLELAKGDSVQWHGQSADLLIDRMVPLSSPCAATI
nr:hypothetical protein L203_06662 [Cryptococcus depauperatus CBS 7841]